MSRGSKKTEAKDVFTFAGKSAKTVDIAADEKELIIIKHDAAQALAIAWDVDPSGYGYWRIQQIGVEEGRLVTKELRKGEVGAAFYGEVSVVGAGNNDLYTSDGFEDADSVDPEGNVTNKVREIRIFPRRHT